MHLRRFEVEMLFGESNCQGGAAFYSYQVLGFVPVAGAGVVLTVVELVALVQAEHSSHERSAMAANVIRSIFCRINWQER